MAGGVIGALRVTLGLSTAAFETGLKKARGGLASFGSFAKTSVATAATALVAVATGVGLAVTGMLEKADKMGKLAQSVGVPVDELSRLAYAADLADINLDSLAVALKRQSKGMNDAAGGTGAAAAAYERLGISVTDSEGKLRSNTDVMADVADRFAGMQDGATKTALAMAIFGKSGADMIPLLNGGAAGLREMTAEADALGLTIDEKTAKAAEAFNDNLKRLKGIGEGLTTQLATRLAPALETFSEVMLRAARNSAAMDGLAQALDITFRALATVVLTLAGSALALIGTITTLLKALTQLDVRAGGKGPKAALEELQKGFVQVAGTSRATIGQIPALWRDVGNQTRAASKRVGKDLAAPMEEASGNVREATKEISDAAKEAADQEAEGLRLIADLQSEGEKAAIDYSAKLAILRRELDAGRISADTYDDALERLNDQFNATTGAMKPVAFDSSGGPDFQSSADRVGAVQDEIKQSANNARESFAGAFADGIEAAAEGRLKDYLVGWLRDISRRGFEDLGRQLFDILKGTGLGGGGGFDVGSFISSIFSTGGFSLPGFANGTDFIVRGAGGIDKNLLMARVSSGERVKVETPAQQRANRVRGGVTIVQNFPKGDPDSFRRSSRSVTSAMKRALGV